MTSSLPSSNSSIASNLLPNDGLQTGGLPEQATLDEQTSPISPNPVGETTFANGDEPLPEAEFLNLDPQQAESLFPTNPIAIPATGTYQTTLLNDLATAFPQADTLAPAADLTDSSQPDPLLGNGQAPVLSSPTTQSLPTSAEHFNVLVEGKLIINSGGDFDGNPVLVNDDSHIYAGGRLHLQHHPHSSHPTRRNGPTPPG